MKKWLHNNEVPIEEKSIAEPKAKELAEQLTKKFMEEKAKGKTIQDLKDGNILTEETGKIKEYNHKSAGQQIEIWGNTQYNSMQVQFVNHEGDVAEEIVSTTTPKDVDRDVYYDQFKPLNNTDSSHQEKSSESTPQSFYMGSPKTNSPTSEKEGEKAHVSPNPLEMNSSSSLPSKVDNSLSKELPTVSLKRKRDENDDDSEQKLSKQKVTEDIVQDTGPDIYEMAGDD